ncbi:UNVERIFIED_CONTAM: hypothetical protein Slati_1696900 [Sesamum latifolium]|uniref:Uncharacterized protein n=1 Tax=Sesamum latifolium TaxID=2727402 RepID=A0AAW2WVJ6_9LAMI
MTTSAIQSSLALPGYSHRVHVTAVILQVRGLLPYYRIRELKSYRPSLQGFHMMIPASQFSRVTRSADPTHLRSHRRPTVLFGDVKGWGCGTLEWVAPRTSIKYHCIFIFFYFFFSNCRINPRVVVGFLPLGLSLHHPMGIGPPVHKLLLVLQDAYPRPNALDPALPKLFLVRPNFPHLSALLPEAVLRTQTDSPEGNLLIGRSPLLQFSRFNSIPMTLQTLECTVSDMLSYSPFSRILD